MNLLLYVFYVSEALFEMFETLAPFDTNVLFGAKYVTSLFINLFGMLASYAYFLGPNV